MSTNRSSSLDELTLIVRGVGKSALALVALTSFFFFFGVSIATFSGLAVPVPVPAPVGESFAALFFERMQNDLVSSTVRLVVTSPMEAFAAQVEIALVLALIVLLPVFLVRTVAFFSDALTPHERRALVRVIVPSVLLSATGAAFAYLYVIPPTFSVLYGYATPLGAETLLSVGGFVGTVVGLTFAIGIMFMTPVAMVMLARLGVVRSAFWIEKWRYALLTLLIFSAIITPDGSGITMLLVSVPLVALYGVGCVASTHARHPLLN